MTNEQAVQILEIDRWKAADGSLKAETLQMGITALRRQDEYELNQGVLLTRLQNMKNYVDELKEKRGECMTKEEHSRAQQQQVTEKNEPLTLEELRKMDGQPVWIEFIPDPCDAQIKIWALASVDPEDGEIFLINSLGGSSAYEEVAEDIRAIYRRPPEKEKTARGDAL